MARRLSIEPARYIGEGPSGATVVHGEGSIHVSIGWPTKVWIDTAKTDDQGRAVIHQQQPPDWDTHKFTLEKAPHTDEWILSKASLLSKKVVDRFESWHQAIANLFPVDLDRW